MPHINKHKHGKCASSIANSGYTREFIPTGRKCRYCNEEIYKVKDKEGIIIFDHYFFCHRDKCFATWKNVREDE